MFIWLPNQLVRFCQQFLIGLFACVWFTLSQAATFPASSFLSNLDGIELVDQSGATFNPLRLADHVVLFSFIYTHCSSTCPVQTRVLADVLQALPDDVRRRVRFVSVSIDPKVDTPAQLQQFAERLQADVDGWTFLTGNQDQIDRLTRQLHLFDESDPQLAATPQIHRTDLWLVDSLGRMLQRYNGDPPDRDRLIRELSQVSRMATGASKTN